VQVLQFVAADVFHFQLYFIIDGDKCFFCISAYCCLWSVFAYQKLYLLVEVFSLAYRDYLFRVWLGLSLFVVHVLYCCSLLYYMEIKESHRFDCNEQHSCV